MTLWSDPAKTSSSWSDPTATPVSRWYGRNVINLGASADDANYSADDTVLEADDTKLNINTSSVTSWS